MSPRLPGRGGASDREGRSAEAREKARLEREARRAAREGREPAALPDLPDDLRPRESLRREPEAPGEQRAEPTGIPLDDQSTQAWAPVEDEPDPFADEPEPPAPAARTEAPPARQDQDFFDGPDDEPFADAPAAPAPDPEPPVEPEPDPVRPVIPPRPALSWERDDAPPTRVQPPADDRDRSRDRAIPTRADVELPGTDDVPAVRVLGADGEAGGDPDRPLGTKRVAASSMASAAGAQGPPRFGAPPRGTPRSRRGMRRVVPALFIIFLLVVLYGVNKVVQPFHGAGKGRVSVVIPDGSGAKQIGDQLVKAGVIDNATIFSLRARISGDRDKLRSGPHVFKKDMSYADVLKELTFIPKVAPTIQVAIPEGLTVKQVASIARKADLRGSYAKAAASASARRTARTLGLPTGRSTLEGFFFPATYRLKTTASSAALVKQQLATFKREVATVSFAYAKKKKLTRYDVLIIASLIENEAQTASDRPKIAAVIYNRLRQGIPLQIDATTRYETGNYGANARPIRQSELDADTPYNTRNKKGLPPTPISSPGVASLKAAARPANVPYLYYVVKPCGNGAHNFSASDAQFQKDVAAYNAKRTQLGGKDPSTC